MSDPDDPIVETFFGAPITRRQAARSQESWAAVLALRERAGYRPLVDVTPTSGSAGVNCARCASLGDFSDEGMRGYCSLIRRMVATWHNCECALFTVRTAPRASDVLKAQLARQEQERKP